MKKTLTLLFIPLAAALLSSCVTNDYDSGYNYGNNGYYNNGYYNNGYYYGQPPPPPRRYYRDDRYDDDYRHDNRRHYRDDDRHYRDDDRRQKNNRPETGEFQAGGGAKEYSFSAGHYRCTITILDGSVGFNTIVIRAGGNKRSQTIGAKFQRGQSFDVPIDRDSTGLRISDTGRGRYRVSVR